MLFQDRAGQRILVVTHGITLRAFRVLLERLDHYEAEDIFKGDPPKNCGVTDYEYDQEKERLVLKGYNKVYW